jgi:hypothetical protein
MITTVQKTFDTPEARWAGVGPYYAMFPSRFANRVVERFTDAGDTVIDPFAGRGTALFSAATRGRHALGVEINPVGWVYAATKLAPAPFGRVANRLTELAKLSQSETDSDAMPMFFRYCFSPKVLAFLLTARRHLDWKSSIIDRTLMALLLVDLHGKRNLAFSNQMRQTKSMSPDYAIRWWRRNRLQPPERDPVEFVMKKMQWRYARGRPKVMDSRVYLGDSTHSLAGMRAMTSLYAPRGAKLLLTSPPYFGITNYHYDQWLRLWLLGGPAAPRSTGDKHKGKFTNPAEYESLLMNAFSRMVDLLARDAIVYVRTDRRRITAKTTRKVLLTLFPDHTISRHVRPVKGISQTRLFTSALPKNDEIDFVLRP